MKFVTFIKFTDQGIQEIQQTTSRAAAFAEQAHNSGLKISELLWTNGRFDGVMVYSAPDAETAAAVMLQLSQNGRVKTETLNAFDATAMNKVLAMMT